MQKGPIFKVESTESDSWLQDGHADQNNLLLPGVQKLSDPHGDGESGNGRVNYAWRVPSVGSGVLAETAWSEANQNSMIFDIHLFTNFPYFYDLK